MRLVRFLFAVVLGSFPSALFLNAQPVPMRGPASRPIALPLQFEENIGQYNLPMQFAVSGASGRLALEPGGTLVWLVGDTTVRVIPVGGNSRSRPVSDDLQITRRNYYYSIPVPREYTNVRSFGRVRYPEIYPGIDLVYYGSEGQLEYDFEVAPGADASAIALRVEGGTADLHNGDLILRSGGEELTIKAPRSYQVHNGGRSEVKSAFSMLDSATFRFTIKAYDSTLPLIIDPAVRYTAVIALPAPFLPTSFSRGVAADSLGNVYVSAETNFVVAVFHGITDEGPMSCTVTKINPQGTAILYQTTLDVQGIDRVPAVCGQVAVDSGGNAYFSAHGTITPTPGAVQPVNRGTNNSFIKLDPSGQVSYATYFGGSGGDFIDTLTVDSAGDLVVFGGTNSNDFPLKNPLQTSLNTNGGAAFIFSLNASGTGVNFSTFFGSDTGGSLATDNTNNIYLSGSGGFPTQNAAIANCTPVTFLRCNMVTKFTPAGAVVFSTFVSADGSLKPEGVAVNSAGTVFLEAMFINNPSQALGQLTLSTVDKTNGSLTPVNIPPLNGVDANAFVVFPLIIDAADNIYMGGSNQLLSMTSAGAVNFLVSLPGDMSIFRTSTLSSGGIAASPGGNFYILNPTFAVNPLVLLGGGVGSFEGSVAAFSSVDAASLGYEPAAPDFGNVQVGTQGHLQIEIVNYGSLPLTISNATATGDFSATNNGCNTNIMSSTPACSIDVVFNPPGVGTQTGSLTITSNALTSTTVIPLSGTAVPPTQLAFSAMSLNLGDTPVNGISAPQTVTVSINGTSPVTFARIDTTGDFIESNTCGLFLPLGVKCTISVVLHPTAAGARTGTVVLTDDLAGSPQTINLTGNGIAGFFINSQTINPSITVFAGQSGSTQLNLGSSLGFAGAVNLSCSGMPANSTCTVSPNSVQLAANGTTPITISVTTVARPSNAGLLPQGGAPWPGTFTLLAASLLALVLSTLFAGRSRKLTFAGATLLALAFAGCGGGGGGSSTPPPVVGTPNGVFIITVTGTSGTITQSQAISLNVN